MPRQRRWRRSKRRECMAGSRKLRSPRMFVGNGAAVREIRCEIGRKRSSPSLRISVKCRGSALQKKPDGIGPGFRLRKRGGVCGGAQERGRGRIHPRDRQGRGAHPAAARRELASSTIYRRIERNRKSLHLDMLQKDGLQKVRFEASVEARDARSFVHAEHSSPAKRDAAIRRTCCGRSFS